MAVSRRTRVTVAEVELADERVALFVESEHEAHPFGIVRPADEAGIAARLEIFCFVAVGLAGHAGIVAELDHNGADLLGSKPILLYTCRFRAQTSYLSLVILSRASLRASGSMESPASATHIALGVTHEITRHLRSCYHCSSLLFIRAERSLSEIGAGQKRRQEAEKRTAQAGEERGAQKRRR